MAEHADPDKPIDLGEVSRAEYELLLRAIQALKEDLVEEASTFAQKKMSRKDGSLEEIIIAGRKRLAMITQINELRERWIARFGKA